MVKKIVSLFLFAVLAYSNFSYALERDYIYEGVYLGEDCNQTREEDGIKYFFYRSDELSFECFDAATQHFFAGSHTGIIEIEYIPVIGGAHYFDECVHCYEDFPIYAGYFHFRFNQDYPFLKKQIAYTKKYPAYNAYWPETSEKAENISNVAVAGFVELVNSTDLRKIIHQPRLYNDFFVDSWYFHTLDSVTLPRALSVNCFRFTDFFEIGSHLKEFASSHYPFKKAKTIEKKVDALLDELAYLFLDMYAESMALHPTEEIAEEIDFIESYYFPFRM